MSVPWMGRLAQAAEQVVLPVFDSSDAAVRQDEALLADEFHQQLLRGQRVWVVRHDLRPVSEDRCQLCIRELSRVDAGGDLRLRDAEVLPIRLIPAVVWKYLGGQLRHPLQ